MTFIELNRADTGGTDVDGPKDDPREEECKDEQEVVDEVERGVFLVPTEFLLSNRRCRRRPIRFRRTIGAGGNRVEEQELTKYHLKLSIGVDNSQSKKVGA